MSIWTSKRDMIALAVAFSVSGCLQAPDVTTAAFGFTRSAPQTIEVADKSIVIGGPPGYCVDRSGSKLGGESAFVLLASCASISRDARAGSPRTLGLLTASVAKTRGPGLLSQPDVLEAFIASPGGRAAMARDGRSASVEILDTRRLDDAVLIHLRDTSQGAIAEVEDVYWRGLTEVNGRLVTISVVSFSDKPLGRDESLATLRSFLARIRAESPTQAAVN